MTNFLSFCVGIISINIGFKRLNKSEAMFSAKTKTHVKMRWHRIDALVSMCRIVSHLWLDQYVGKTSWVQRSINKPQGINTTEPVVVPLSRASWADLASCNANS